MEREIPAVITQSDVFFDIDEVDGQISMFDRSFAGSIVLPLSKKMDDTIKGKVTVNDIELGRVWLRTFTQFKNTQVLGLPVRHIMREYGRAYKVLVEGFVDMSGVMMEPQEITVTTLPRKEPVSGYEEHDQVALEAAREGIVLLKNEGNILPLSKGEQLNVFGTGLFDFRTGAVGAGKINPRYLINMIRAIEEHSEFTLNSEVQALYMNGTETVPSQEMLEAACRKSKTALIVISRRSGENLDNSAIQGEYYLSSEEEAMISAVSSTFEQTVAIVNSGYPMDMTWVEKYNIKALINCGFAGMFGGLALVEILDGRVNPSAKLPDTWSYDYYDHPASRNFYDTVDGKPFLNSSSPQFVDTYYEEDIYVGYRYFETFQKAVAYPFGFGLSYTTFGLNITSFEHDDEGTTLNLQVKNTGNTAGKEVVQVYAEEPDGELEKPSRKLVAFAKTETLQPGETQEITCTIPTLRYASYDSDAASWLMEQGRYIIWAGTSVKHVQRAGDFQLSEDRTLKKVVNRMVPPVPIQTLSKLDPEATYPQGALSGFKPEATELAPKANRPKYQDKSSISAETPDTIVKFTDVMEQPERLYSFVKQLSVEELARLSVCGSSGWGMHEKGEAGRVFLLDRYDMKPFVVADGNSGVNLKKPNIGMPTSTVVCSSWNTKLSYEVARVIAEEATENNIHMILAPGMNIHRNPLNGRHPEYFSEDPYLTGIMAGYFSKGLEENGVSSCLKHIVANNCETVRNRNHSLMTERALREIYLKAFEVALEVHQPDSIMTGYNAVNGVFAAADEEMIQGIFREELGFDGYVMTDWGSYETADIVEAVQAGNCWMTPGTNDDTYVLPIVNGVKEGRIDRTRLEKNVWYLLKVVLKRAQD
ncbi:glycoside hydrolase family 3 C-terminal domain-containing protein [Paenibacillus amylolyticus]|uniref:glycoside hydrolase family 3 protein n=1 Tax=Paenibacillus amylolyticus TaxID=1451 RepID=UPI003EB9F688